MRNDLRYIFNPTFIKSSTRATIDGRDVIVLYGNAGELHETAIAIQDANSAHAKVVAGTGKVAQKITGRTLVLQYTTIGQTVVQVGRTTLLYLLGKSLPSGLRGAHRNLLVDRTNAYDFWVLHPADDSLKGLSMYSTVNPILVKGGYLLRNVSLSNGALSLIGDINATTSFEVIAPATFSAVNFNRAHLPTQRTTYGTLLTSNRKASLPVVNLPSLMDQLSWVSSLLSL